MVRAKTQYLPIISTPCSLGGSQASLMAEQVVAKAPRLDGASGGLAVFTIKLSDLAVRIKALIVSRPTDSASGSKEQHEQ